MRTKSLGLILIETSLLADLDSGLVRSDGARDHPQLRLPLQLPDPACDVAEKTITQLHGNTCRL
jgi:hypothetical protein